MIENNFKKLIATIQMNVIIYIKISRTFYDNGSSSEKKFNVSLRQMDF